MISDVRITGLDEAIDGLTAALDVDLREGMLRAAQAVAEEAASSHAYQNRTGSLQAATQAGAQRGQASDGEIVVEVVGDTDYGEYVEGNPDFAFLAPAAERADGRIEEELEAALERAVQRAGWT
jgi:hypothetical protein